MSLISSASTWINDDNLNKKRTPSLNRKTTKNRPYLQGVGEPEEYPQPNETFNPTSMDELQSIANDRSSRVNDLLNKITSVDETNSKMGDFNPLNPPSVNVKKDMTDNNEVKQYVPPMPAFYSGNAGTSNDPKKQSNQKYSANENQSFVYSNYSKSYEPPQTLPGANNVPYYSKMGISPKSDDKLMEKINYMIHLLEEKHNEKTNNITEEFILYTFLGVFIIFVVDSFARSGKYTR
jgi:hypothetical protein